MGRFVAGCTFFNTDLTFAPNRMGGTFFITWAVWKRSSGWLRCARWDCSVSN